MTRPEATALCSIKISSTDMPNSRTQIAADRKRINVHEDHELRYWSEQFNASHDQLRRAVSKVGDMADDVARELLRKPRGRVPDDLT